MNRFWFPEFVFEWARESTSKWFFHRRTPSNKVVPWFPLISEMENLKARAKRLMDSFKLTVDSWEIINRYQRGLCALCGRPCHTGRRLATDHAHADGLVRGLLCSQCNPILGKLENAWVRLGMHKQDSVTLVDFVRRLLAYLMTPPATTALGHEHYGYPGKVNTKKHRLMLRRKMRQSVKEKRRDKACPKTACSVGKVNTSK